MVGYRPLERAESHCNPGLRDAEAVHVEYLDIKAKTWVTARRSAMYEATVCLERPMAFPISAERRLVFLLYARQSLISSGPQSRTKVPHPKWVYSAMLRIEASPIYGCSLFPGREGLFRGKKNDPRFPSKLERSMMLELPPKKARDHGSA